jgi:hypothetical protein
MSVIGQCLAVLDDRINVLYYDEDCECQVAGLGKYSQLSLDGERQSSSWTWNGRVGCLPLLWNVPFEAIQPRFPREYRFIFKLNGNMLYACAVSSALGLTAEPSSSHALVPK